MTSEGFAFGAYLVTGFKGTLVWNVPSDNGCAASSYSMKVNGTTS